MNRMLFQRRMVEAARIAALPSLFAPARATRDVVEKPMTKGTVSAAITKIIPSGWSKWCRGCQATHVHDQVMRLATVHGGTRTPRPNCAAPGGSGATQGRRRRD